MRCSATYRHQVDLSFAGCGFKGLALVWGFGFNVKASGMAGLVLVLRAWFSVGLSRPAGV